MYESFFGFREKPFNMTPDPRFLYLSETHREALAQLIYGVKERKGFVVLSGGVGTGKTTVVRAMLERLDENCQVAYVFNTKLSVTDFLKFVCHDLGLEVSRESKIDYLIKLHDFLIESHNDGKTTTLIVDEAQNLDASVFEEIRMLTNLETSSQKLLQIFLVGQPELNALVDQSDLWQLKQRISTRYHLLPLDQKETREYIHTRMRIAGAKRLNCFTEGAIQRIYEYSQGIPRLINNICDNSLLVGYATDTPVINERTVRESVADLRLEKDLKNHKPSRKVQEDNQKSHSFVHASLFIILIGLLAAGIILFLSGKISVPKSLLKPPETAQPSSRESQENNTRHARTEKTEIPTPSETGLLAATVPQQTAPPNEPQGTPVVGLAPAEVPHISAEPESPETRIAIAREGETVSHIILREFGRVDTHLVEAVQKLNPDIEDIDQIVVGQEIRLPLDPNQAYENPGAPCCFSAHVASFKRLDRANKLFNDLMQNAENPTIVRANINGSAWYRVATGEYRDFTEASLNAKKLVQTGRFNYAKPMKMPELRRRVK